MRLSAFIWFSVLLLVLLGVFGPAYARYSRLRDRLARTEKEITAIERMNERLRKKIKLLSENPAALEEIARYKYKMGRPGEVVYVVASED